MAQAADIKDEWSLSLWLSGQNDFVPLQIASRASLRLLPIWTSFAETPEAKNRNIELLPVLRGFLATSISPSFSEMENEKLLSRVAPYAERARVNLDNIRSIKDISAEIDLTSISRYHFRDVASASLSVLATRTGRRTKREEQVAHEMAGGSIAYAASVGLLPDAGPVEISIDAESHEYWQSVLSDADAAESGIYLKDIPLWPVETPLLRLWEKTRQDWSQPNSPYAFWLRWYDSLLDPKATPPFADDLLYRIALIDDAIWKAGAEAVAQAILELESNNLVGLDQGDEGDERAPLPSQNLQKNTRTIRLQLDTLRSLLQTEIDELRGRNSVPDTERPDFEKRIEILTRLIARVDAMAEEFDGGIATENALVVVEENLPAIPDEAAALQEAGGPPEVSDLVVSMGATIEHLTKRGTPGTIASGIAAFDYFWTQVRDWRSKRKSKQP